MKKGIWPLRKTWYSICTKHKKYNSSCPKCNRGNWISDTKYQLNKFVYMNFPKIWKWWIKL